MGRPRVPASALSSSVGPDPAAVLEGKPCWGEVHVQAMQRWGALLLIRTRGHSPSRCTVSSEGAPCVLVCARRCRRPRRTRPLQQMAPSQGPLVAGGRAAAAPVGLPSPAARLLGSCWAGGWVQMLPLKLLRPASNGPKQALLVGAAEVGSGPDLAPAAHACSADAAAVGAVAAGWVSAQSSTACSQQCVVSDQLAKWHAEATRSNKLGAAGTPPSRMAASHAQ